MADFDCPSCDFEFEASRFEDGECPNCGNEYSYDGENCTEDYSDYWDEYTWRLYSRELGYKDFLKEDKEKE